MVRTVGPWPKMLSLSLPSLRHHTLHTEEKTYLWFPYKIKTPTKGGPYSQKYTLEMKNVGNNALFCPYIRKERKYRRRTLHGIWTIPFIASPKRVLCTWLSVKSNAQRSYIGETERFWHDHICKHIGDIRTRKLEKPVAKHFKLTRYSLSDMTATKLKKVKVDD